jgi:hypothetical protein
LDKYVHHSTKIPETHASLNHIIYSFQLTFLNLATDPNISHTPKLGYSLKNRYCLEYWFNAFVTLAITKETSPIQAIDGRTLYGQWQLYPGSADRD